MDGRERREGRGHNDARGMLTGGLIVLGIGVLFLLKNLGVIPNFNIVWPVIPIIVGISLIASAVMRMKRAE